jgi:outer membrane protein assembly factor BamB
MRSRFLLVAALLVGGCGTATVTGRPTVESPAPSGAISAAPAPSLDPAPAAILTYRGDAARTGSMPGPGPLGTPSIRWTFQAGAPIGSQVAVVGKVVYVASTDGTLHAVDLETGTQRWSVSIGAESHGSVSVVDNLVIAVADDGVHAFATADGRAAWVSTKTGEVRGAPAVVGHVAVFASDDGRATALDTRTGSLLWQKPLGAPDNSSVAAADGLVALGLQNGVMVVLALADGSGRWRTDTGDGARIGTPTIAGGRVYVATLDGGGPGSRHITALDLATGKVLWRFASPGDEPAYAPAIADGRAIVEGEDGRITALDPATGSVLWQAKAPGLVEVVAAIADGVSYGASNGGYAFALDAATGKELWRLPIEGIPYGAAVTAGLVLVGTDVGTLDAIGGSGS